MSGGKNALMSKWDPKLPSMGVPRKNQRNTAIRIDSESFGAMSQQESKSFVFGKGLKRQPLIVLAAAQIGKSYNGDFSPFLSI